MNFCRFCSKDIGETGQFIECIAKGFYGVQLFEWLGYENQPYFWMRKAFASNLNRILTKYLSNSFFMLFIVISCGKSRGIQQENVAQVSYQENKNLE